MPVDLVVLGAGVFDDGGFVEVSSSTMGSVFIEPGSEVPTRLADVYLAAFTRNPVDAWLSLGVLLVLVSLEQSLNLVGGSVKDFDVMVKKDTLDLM